VFAVADRDRYGPNFRAGAPENSSGALERSIQMRVPRAPKNPQNAEQSVTHAIEIALAQIEEHDPTLGGLLRDGIETGQFLSYTPKDHQTKRRKGGSSAKLSTKVRGLKPR
jgi:hypothetical protein